MPTNTKKRRQTTLTGFLELPSVASPLSAPALLSNDSLWDDDCWMTPPSKLPSPKLEDSKIYSISRIEILPNGDKVVDVDDPDSPAVFSVSLEGFWSYSLLKRGDSVLFTGVAESLRVTDAKGMVIVNPQRIVSVTTLANSHFCPRKSILSQRFATPFSNKSTVTGLIVHKLIEMRCWTAHLDLEAALDSVMRTNRDILIAMAVDHIDPAEVRANILSTYSRGILDFPTKIDPELRIESTEEAVTSGELGITGKVDVLGRRPDGSLVPIELKSGKDTNQVAHSAQVLLYSLLVSPGLPGLLYYPAEGGVTRRVGHSPSQVNSLVQARNLICHHLDSAPGDLPEMISNPGICRKCPQAVVCLLYCDSIPPALAGVVGHLQPNEVKYFMHWQELLFLERAEGSPPGFVEVRRVGHLPPPVVRFELRCGAVTPGTFLYFGGKDCKLVVEEATGRYFTATCRFDPEKILLDRDYELSTDQSEYLYNVGLAFLAGIMGNGPSKRELRSLVVEGVQSPREPVGGARRDWGLNDGQNRVVERVMAGEDQAVLVVGYPGSGKTTLMARVIGELAAAGQSVLVVSHTNSAVDGLATRLAELGVAFWRFGSRGGDGLGEHSFEDRVGGMEPAQLRDMFYSRNVVASTCYGCVHPLLSSREYDWCVVDESSQILQPIVLGPLALARRACFVGDPLQLLPLARSKSAKSRGICNSLLSDLANLIPPIPLTLQYRMNRVITKLANLLMYDNQLECGGDHVANGTLGTGRRAGGEDYMSRVGSCALEDSVLFLDYVGDRSSVCNHGEAAIVARIVRELRSLDVPDSAIGVITPFNAQCCLVNNFVKPVECSTIDRFQGREKDVIIISFVKCGSPRGENSGILNDLRRLSVAVTRAKYKLIMIGDRQTLETNYYSMKRLFACIEPAQIVNIFLK